MNKMEFVRSLLIEKGISARLAKTLSISILQICSFRYEA